MASATGFPALQHPSERDLELANASGIHANEFGTDACLAVLEHPSARDLELVKEFGIHANELVDACLGCWE